MSLFPSRMTASLLVYFPRISWWFPTQELANFLVVAFWDQQRLTTCCHLVPLSNFPLISFNGMVSLLGISGFHTDFSNLFGFAEEVGGRGWLHVTRWQAHAYTAAFSWAMAPAPQCSRKWSSCACAHPLLTQVWMWACSPWLLQSGSKWFTAMGRGLGTLGLIYKKESVLTFAFRAKGVNWVAHLAATVS